MSKKRVVQAGKCCRSASITNGVVETEASFFVHMISQQEKAVFRGASMRL